MYVSLSLSTVSPITETFTVLLVWPGSNVTVVSLSDV